MPRRYYSRRTKVVRPRKKWASNLDFIELDSVSGILMRDLCSNSVQSSSPTPVVVKVGNFKARLDSQVTTTTSVTMWPALNFFVVYMPEGFTLPTNPSAGDLRDYVVKHPEWVMCSAVAGSNVAGGTTFDMETVTFSSRLKRNLNSGDQIMLFAFPPPGYSSLRINLRGTIKFWTCAN